MVNCDVRILWCEDTWHKLFKHLFFFLQWCYFLCLFHFSVIWWPSRLCFVKYSSYNCIVLFCFPSLLCSCDCLSHCGSSILCSCLSCSVSTYYDCLKLCFFADLMQLSAVVFFLCPSADGPHFVGVTGDTANWRAHKSGTSWPSDLYKMHSLMANAFDGLLDISLSRAVKCLNAIDNLALRLYPWYPLFKEKFLGFLTWKRHNFLTFFTQDLAPR